ncbi:uncharacterized protein [Panulirus ornatus]|uniref:uncharacterized protein isoform X1 n=1 Tax=Panulirus ornatus TaxID=150431 RepID=UPI003A87B2ED
MVAAIHSLLFLLPLFINAVLSLPLLSDNTELNRGAGTLTMQSPLAAFDDDNLQTLYWLWALHGGGTGTSAAQPSSRDALSERQRPQLRFQPQRDLPVAKRTDGKIPTMGLGKRSSTYVPYFSVGVLSNMRKFFNELRTNLDSVEEVAALSQEQGGPLDAADFLALLAKHGAKLQVKQGSRGGQDPPNPSHMRRLMFGYNNDDQPYAHSGLGK